MHRFLKPKSIQWMKSKGGLNESEAAELIADLEAYQQQLKQATNAFEMIYEAYHNFTTAGRIARETLSLIREDSSK